MAALPSKQSEVVSKQSKVVSKETQILEWIDELYNYYTIDLEGIEVKSVLPPVIRTTLNSITKQLHQNFMKHAETKINDIFEEHASIGPSAYRDLAGAIFYYLWDLYNFNNFIPVSMEELISICGVNCNSDLFGYFYQELLKEATNEDQTLKSVVSNAINRGIKNVKEFAVSETKEEPEELRPVVIPITIPTERPIAIPTEQPIARPTERSITKPIEKKRLITAEIPIERKELMHEFKRETYPSETKRETYPSETKRETYPSEFKRCHDQSYHNMRCLEINKYIGDNWREESKCEDYCRSIPPQKMTEPFWYLINLTFSNNTIKYNEFLSIVNILPAIELRLLTTLWNLLFNIINEDVLNRIFGGIGISILNQQQRYNIINHIISLGPEYVRNMLLNPEETFTEYVSKYYKNPLLLQGPTVVNEQLFFGPINSRIFGGSELLPPMKEVRLDQPKMRELFPL